jgi:transcriptional regulator with XRE-family HTH domain
MSDGLKTRKRKRKGRGGRDSKITSDLLKRVREMASNNMNQRQIASILGVSACTLSIWKSREGKLEEKFRKAIEQGYADGLNRRLKRIEKAGKKGNVSADQWMVERMAPEQFGRTQQIRIGNPDGSAMESAPTVIAPTVVFVQPAKQQLGPVIEVETNQLNGGNGHGLPEGNGKH